MKILTTVAMTTAVLLLNGGSTNSFIEGMISWNVTPTVTNTGPVLCIGNFTLGQPMF